MNWEKVPSTPPFFLYKNRLFHTKKQLQITLSRNLVDFETSNMLKLFSYLTRQYPRIDKQFNSSFGIPMDYGRFIYVRITIKAEDTSWQAGEGKLKNKLPKLRILWYGCNFRSYWTERGSNVIKESGKSRTFLIPYHARLLISYRLLLYACLCSYW